MKNIQLSIPQHLAIIMDGNRRWARERNLPIIAGHQKVVNEILEPLIEYASDVGIKYMTFWAFSTENWNREPFEIKGIMKLLRDSLQKFGEKMHRKGCRIVTIGDMSRFSEDIQKTVSYLIDLTKNNTKITTIFALNYGGRDEIIRAIKKSCQLSVVSCQNISENEFSKYLDTTNIPDPDMIVRTGGEQRLSGFLLWQCQYSELYFPAWYMPEFSKEKLDEVINEFKNRQRRFGH